MMIMMISSTINIIWPHVLVTDRQVWHCQRSTCNYFKRGLVFRDTV